MNVTDQDMAEALSRTVSEIREIKKLDESKYLILKTGVLCKKLGLNEDDLQKIHDMKIVSAK